MYYIRSGHLETIYVYVNESETAHEKKWVLGREYLQSCCAITIELLIGSPIFFSVDLKLESSDNLAV